MKSIYLHVMLDDDRPVFAVDETPNFPEDIRLVCIPMFDKVKRDLGPCDVCSDKPAKFVVFTSLRESSIEPIPEGVDLCLGCLGRPPWLTEEDYHKHVNEEEVYERP